MPRYIPPQGEMRPLVVATMETPGMAEAGRHRLNPGPVVTKADSLSLRANSPEHVADRPAMWTEERVQRMYPRVQPEGSQTLLRVEEVLRLRAEEVLLTRQIERQRRWRH